MLFCQHILNVSVEILIELDQLCDNFEILRSGTSFETNFVLSNRFL